MGDMIHVPANERRTIRLFHLDLPAERIAGFARPDPQSGEWPLREALGASHLDPEGVEVFPISDLDGMGLADYLIEGQGIPAGQVAADRARLNALAGHIVLVSTRALGGAAQVLTPRAPLRWIGTYSEEFQPASMTPLRSTAAGGEVGAPPSPVSPQVPPIRMLALAAAGLFIVIIAILIFAL